MYRMVFHFVDLFSLIWDAGTVSEESSDAAE